MNKVYCFLAIHVALVAGEAEELTPSTFEDSVVGQNAFIKFLAPWCGHCKSLKPDWDQLADTFADHKVTIADVDCTVHDELCSKYEIKGYPTLKVFKRDGSIDDYNGGRSFDELKKFVDTNLDEGPMCSLEGKSECTAEDLAILEESEQMTRSERDAKITELEELISKKTEDGDDIDADEDAMNREVKALGSKLRLMKLGGDKLEQLLSDKDFRSECETKTCILSFLPHILDGGAKVRNEMLAALAQVRKTAKAERIPVGFFWLQGGDQFEIEEKLSLAFGWPAVIVINLKKERYGVHRGTFDQDSLKAFLRSLMIGKVPLHPLPKGLDKFPKNKPWDGKDGELPQEEEL